MDLFEEHRKRLLEIFRRIPKGVPEGWEAETFAVGGLLYLGFSNVRTEQLVSVSTQGQRVINCATFEKTYCDENYDENDLIACAEPLGDELVPLAGEGGGGLRRFSPEGGFLDRAAPLWPEESIVFMPAGQSWYQNPERCTILFEDYEIRAYGFSRCGQYMAMGSSSTLMVFRRKRS